MKWFKRRNNQLIISMIVAMIGIISVVIGISYAIFTTTISGTSHQVIKTGSLKLSYTETNGGLELLNIGESTDEEGMYSDDYYEFTIANIGNAKAEFDILLADDTTSNASYGGTVLSQDFIRAYIEGGYIETLTTEDRIIFTDTLDVNQSKTYKLRLWLNFGDLTQAQKNALKNQQAYFKIKIDAKQSFNTTRTIAELYQSEDLHIGDFVTYDAGTWTASEIASIQVGPNDGLVSANNSLDAPSTAYQFGGFVAGQSRNVGAIENTSYGNYIYAKMYDDNDSSNQVPLSGWRIFDIDEDNETVTLISAANPEDYYLSAKTNSAYISQYILTGTKDSSWTDDESNYTKRDWSMYENSAYNASNARVLTKTDLDNWYNKYTESTFQRIYSSPYLAYQNLIDNHTWYWLGSAFVDPYLFAVVPREREVLGNSRNALGVRVLVSIPLTSSIQEDPVARRTVTLDGMSYTGGTYGSESVQEYNVWDLAVE